MDASRFEVGDGPDGLILSYSPDVILELARTIQAARDMGLADPLPEMLATKLTGTLVVPTPA